MTDLTLHDAVRPKKENLTLRFALAAIVAIILSSLLIGVAAYHLMRDTSLQSGLNRQSQKFVADLSATTDFKQFDADDLAKQAIWKALQRRYDLLELAFIAPDKSLLWESNPGMLLQASESYAFEKIASGKVREGIVLSQLVYRYADVRAVLDHQYKPLYSLIPIYDKSGGLMAVAKCKHNFDGILEATRNTLVQLMMVIIFSHILLVLLLYYNFRRGIKTIENQEKKVSQQIARLSNLLALNKTMQQSMKSASSRAVELNEQFLRRVGSDLHDGPAQSIGYAVMRLQQVNDKVTSKELGHEFHVVKEALDSSLTEIRQISSGLVLPELDQLTLEESLRRVVSRHTSGIPIEIKQYYTNLPETIVLPIKICAYRFVQEGLNNASRHGRAEKCRVTAYVKDDVLHLSLKDNGMGFRKSQLSTEGGHLGLMGLKDRIESLGGKFSINSELGVGTAIKVSIALSDED